jgi:hypothetical protein
MRTSAPVDMLSYPHKGVRRASTFTMPFSRVRTDGILETISAL